MSYEYAIMAELHGVDDCHVIESFDNLQDARAKLRICLINYSEQLTLWIVKQSKDIGQKNDH